MDDITEEPGLTDYHAKYFACDLTRKSASNSADRLGQSLMSATVDLNPHQLDAALFAFRSPLSRGVILADEVGLGKTIEAGLVICQLWAEHKRRILIITPTILRKQWVEELAEKFFIPGLVIDTPEYRSRRETGAARPLETDQSVVLCSYQFARSHEAEIRAIPWDLVVIDEAHNLRNVYKPGNKIASAIKSAVLGRPMLLVTATPLQNTLLELYGLVSFIDEHLFGGIDAFRARYMRGPIEHREMHELRGRLSTICQRTLRRQVIEYVRFTNRIPLTQDFTPTEEEQQLYGLVSEYLQRESLNALPSRQRKLMTLILRKLLASSTFAIAGTFSKLAERLTNQRQDLTAILGADFETFDEVGDEWPADAGPEPDRALLADIEAEFGDLSRYTSLAESITLNAKGEALLLALQRGFDKLRELGAQRKAVIFTESVRTQTYLLALLKENGYDDRVMTINGTNADPVSAEIYRKWVARRRGEPVVTGNKKVDLRTALVEHFRHTADILVATEAAAEGINLQFCSLVVNYDLPWNPQRIEQRIGRCHRYGQAHDVVVINFLNRGNEADQRVFELLSEKFRLFDGVFGSSDEVLGALESGVDFEKRIGEIYQSCRTAAEIDAAFAQLREELEEEITARLAKTRTALLENFDEDVQRRLRLSLDGAQACMDRLSRSLWNVTRHELDGQARFDEENLEFILPAGVGGVADPGHYRLVRPGITSGSALPYRLGHPLAEWAVSQASRRILPVGGVTFQYTGSGKKVGLLEPLVNQAGWLAARRLTVNSLESEDHILFAGITDAGEVLRSEACEKLFTLDGTQCEPGALPDTVNESLKNDSEHRRTVTLGDIRERNGRFFDEESEKLDRWADDLKHGLEVELKDLDSEIRAARKESRQAPSLESKLAAHRRIAELESARSQKRRELYEAQDSIDARREELISEVEARIQQEYSESSLFVVRWWLR